MAQIAKGTIRTRLALSASDVTSGENSRLAMGTPALATDSGQDPVDEDGNWTGEPGARPRRFLLGRTAPPVGTRPARRRQPRPGRSRSGATGPRHRQERPGKDCGKGAGGHRRWAETILDPPVDPAARLLNLVRRYCDQTVGMGDRSYRRPSRRNGNPRMAMPSNVAPLPRITVIVDTSAPCRKTISAWPWA